MAEVDAMERDEFTRVLGPVFEHSPWLAEGTWPRRPFRTLDELHRALCDTVAEADAAQQLALIQAHPDLVGRAALAGTLTPASSDEQASAGLDRMSAEEVAAFQKHNADYRQRFGFPFVICARLNKKESILAAFPKRLMNSRPEEIQTALSEVGKIARLRLENLIKP